MAIRGIGSDIVEINRIDDLIKRYGERFLRRVFTVSEIDYCNSRFHPAMHYAGRFAAKEAVAKALYMSGHDDVIPFSHIEIHNDNKGRPLVSVDLPVEPVCHLSISHERTMAIAFAVIDEG